MASTMTQPEFWILTALAAGRRHGYEIMRETERASGGSVSLRVTTLYATLERLERDGLIHVDGEEVVNGRARRYYRLTQVGGAGLEAEVHRLEQAVAVARVRLALPVIPALGPGAASALRGAAA